MEIVDGEIRLKEPSPEPEPEPEVEEAEPEPEPETKPDTEQSEEAETAASRYSVDENGNQYKQPDSKAKSKRSGQTWSESERILLYEVTGKQ